MPIGTEDIDYSDESKSLVIMSKLPKHILIIFFTVHFLSVMSNSKSTMLYAYPELPDLTVKSDDILLLPPYPYPTVNDEIPIRAKVFNIGGETAYNVDVSFAVVLNADTIYDSTVTFDEIKPRCSVDTTVYWNTALTHPDFYGEIGDCEFIVIADPDNEITESWEYNNTSSITKKVALYPNEPGWPKEVAGFSQPAIADLDNEHAVEIVYANLDSIYVFNYDGSTVQSWPQYFKDVYAVVLGDISNNGYIDIVAVSPESIKVYDYQGNILPGWPVQIGLEDCQFTGLPVLGRIDNADSVEVIAYARYYNEETPCAEGPIKIFVYNYDGVLRHQFTSTEVLGEVLWPYGASICDVMSSGNDEIVLSYGKEPSEFYTEIFDNTGSVAVLDYGSNRMISALVDLDNDGYADVITGDEDGKIRAYDVKDNMLLWERQTEGAINCSPAVGDIHPGVPYPGVEITFGNDAGEIHLREKDEGDNIPPWWYTIDPSTNVRTSPAIANMNGDHDIDIMIGADNNYIYAFKYTSDTIAPYPLPLFGKPSSPVIGDIDGDRKNEVILSSRDGYLHVWENKDTKVPPYSLEWPQFHHDYQRTGVYGWVGGLRGGDANPKTFSTGTTLSFSLKKTLHTKIKIYDAEANLVKTLVNQVLPSGTYHPVWFGKDDNYAFLSNGIYFIEIKVRNESKIIPVQINR